jgi:hypothetical protein
LNKGQAILFAVFLIFAIVGANLLASGLMKINGLESKADNPHVFVEIMKESIFCILAGMMMFLGIVGLAILSKF